MLTLTTAGIKIDVLAKYEPGISSPVLNSFVFSYQINITNTNDFSVQLTRRFWDIFDSSGHCREVEGAGVVGEQPFIGANETFVYSSACDLRSPRGRMSGYYTMQHGLTKELFIVRVPDFHLEVPFVMN